MNRDQDGWMAAYKREGALFAHSGNMAHPHALLTSGNHSGFFFNSRLIIANEPLLQEAAFDLVNHLLHIGFDISEIDRVVGPQTGATKLAEFISNAVGELRGHACNWASPAKQGEGDEKKMIWDDPERKVLPGEKVLLCEDVVTTAGSVVLARKAVLEAGGKLTGKILALVNRSPSIFVEDDSLISLIRHEAAIFPPGDGCPYCQQGSAALKAKDPVNWALLTAQ